MWKAKYFPQSFTGNVNLLLTGDLYQSLEILKRGDQYQVNTDVVYAANLFEKYGNFLGIAPENHEKAQEITGKLLAEKFKELVLK
jgi:hypothetical protein